MNTELAEPTPGISVAQIIKQIKEGETKPFDPKYTNYLRSKCSSLKHEFPDRIYSVNKLEGKTEVSYKLITPATSQSKQGLN